MLLRRSLPSAAFLTLAAVSLGLAGLSQQAHAVRPRTGAASNAAAGFARAVVPHDFRGPRLRDRGAQRQLAGLLGPVWVQYEASDGRPSRIALAGLKVPGASADPRRASSDAHRRLTALVALLAPGSTAADFVQVANHYDPLTGARDVAFEQRAGGYVVHGGQLSFRYAHDRLVAIVNDSLGLGVRVPAAVRLGAGEAERRALQIEGAQRSASVQGPRWVTHDRAAKLPARLAYLVEVRGAPGTPLRREVVVDANSGERLANRDLLAWGGSPLRYLVPQRYPAGGRSAFPVAHANVSVDGVDTLTGPDGLLNYPDDNASFSHDLEGPYVRVNDDAGPFDPITGGLTDGLSSTVAPGFDDLLDARLNTFIHTNIVKDRVRQIAPGFAFVDEPLLANVNIADTCNAFWSGDAVNFFVAGDGCENTGRLADVVYHEFGHGAHENGVIPGVGRMNIALSEGLSDYLSATITNDSALAPGFFEGSGEPLRELDPVGAEWTWPDDIGEVHDEGRIIGGAFWDLRGMLQAKYSADIGERLTDRLWFAALQRAYDIPSAYFEVLLADDDDGNLVNGTPNVCEISDAFGAHGLFRAPGEAGQLVLTQRPEGLQVELPLEIPFPQCNITASATLSWRDRANPGDTGTAPMQRVGDRWLALMPDPAPGTVLQYAADLSWSNGTEQHVPSNLADPWLEHYFGPVVPLYCTSFEDGGADGWAPLPPFEIDAPTATTSAGDPQAAFDGELVAGTKLDGDGAYSPNVEHRLLSPTIDVEGFAEYRLQYWRELDVEDGFFDQAYIVANGTRVWENLASSDPQSATVHHRDETWRFHDVDLSDAISGSTLALEFGLLPDGGLEFGGWQIDGLCVVGVGAALCGDGARDPGEDCDDGNTQNGDGCDAQCEVEPTPPTTSAGEAGTSAGEASSESGEGEGGSGIASRGCACTASDGQEQAPGGWLLLAGLGLVRLRRRR